MSKIVKQASFNSKRHAILLAQIAKAQEEQNVSFSELARLALAEYLKTSNGVTLHMLYSKLNAIERRLDNGAVMSASSSAAPPDDVQVGDAVPDFFKDLGT